jgi:nucleoside-diphosphate-sugar epimerase
MQAESMDIRPNYQEVAHANSFYPSVEFGSLDNALSR